MGWAYMKSAVLQACRCQCRRRQQTCMRLFTGKQLSSGLGPPHLQLCGQLLVSSLLRLQLLALRAQLGP